MLNRRKFLLFLSCFPLAFSAAAAARRRLVDLRHSVTPERNRVVFEFDGKVDFNRFILNNPPRFVLDVKHAQIARRVDRAPRFSPDGVVKSLRSHVHADGKLRLVLMLRKRVPVSIRVWPSPKNKGVRIVLDFPGSYAVAPPSRRSTPPRKPAARSQSSRKRPLVVMIDPGHGGKDPGAVGRGKTREKDVVLSISKKLHSMLRADPRVRPHLTRNRDVFLRLYQRTRNARRVNADLFVSVHADAARRRSARGASVYAVSTRGSTSSHAKWLANRENAADLKGGVEISHREPMVQDVMLSMSRGAVQEYSLHAGHALVQSLSRIGKLHSRKVERAAFAVLKSPDIPSILVETGFISNAQEEKLLRSSNHQKRVAWALRSGIREYFARVPEYS